MRSHTFAIDNTLHCVNLSTQIEARGATHNIAGTYAPEYRAVVDAFVENFRLEDEVGAACSIETRPSLL